jgi:hypothetical protein
MALEKACNEFIPLGSDKAQFISRPTGIAVRKALSSSDTTGGIDSRSSSWAFLGLEVYNLSKNFTMY